ncbi:sigma factor-like helix-turn-helix DNA-binding protein [Bacillus velezensis]|uniref:sigma factor-like helix-turn-helix DNA-binding protein n=1 Tax=Bacillus velezensis TaxID=492670 RepID=UPI0009F5A727|nr:sigma factor-like helix-turn-helix DNA-binding protein [Bacillus velezensis]OQV53377.1 RNA polymerase subunit sigma [Bacillus velezensis]OQV55400.1 RNA polymerase subunit sigma [Bacillus velezensis]OQV60891.1 RNA polymerase subunit sigma [Bacillus velezensis]OQV61958.1 RNA polymerase subunit sigma [Bacillus velezensis]
MGVTKIDLHRKDREFNASYALDNAEGVKLLLADYQKFVSRKRCGDYAAVEVLIDIHKAIQLAGLTDRQRQAIELVYFGELTQAEAGERMGIGQDAVSKLIDSATEKLADIYYYWAGHDEGYTTGGRIDG